MCSFTLDNSPSRITSIELDSSGYEGFITPSIGNLTELTIINLSKNHFRGPIPDTISELKKLTRLSLSGNFLTGNLPKRLTALKMLQSLDVSYNQLSGSIPPSISGLSSLTYLSMSNNGFTGIILEISGLWQLRTLDLSRNNLYGRMPHVPLGLRKLMLSHSLLSGHLPALNKLKRMQLLDVSDYKLSGTNTRDIFTLPNLTELNVSINTFTTLEVVRFLGPETQLQVLDAKGNKLRGHLPLNLVTLPNLTSINLSYNQFFSVIPGEFGAKVGAWRILYLDHNSLQGKLPQEFILGPKTIRGSLSNNCLKCPENLPICFGVQKKISECSGQNDMVGKIFPIKMIYLFSKEMNKKRVVYNISKTSILNWNWSYIIQIETMLCNPIHIRIVKPCKKWLLRQSNKEQGIMYTCMNHNPSTL